MSRWNDDGVDDDTASSEQPHIFAPFSLIESSQALLASHHKHASLDRSFLDLESDDGDTDADAAKPPRSTTTNTTLSDSAASAPAQHALWLDTSGGFISVAAPSEPTHGPDDQDNREPGPTTRRVHPDFDPMQQHGNQFLFDPLRLSTESDSSDPQWKDIDLLGLDTPPLTPHKPFSWQSVAPFARRTSSVVGSSASPSPPESPMTPPHPGGLNHEFSPVVGSPARRSSLPVQSVSRRSSLAAFQASPSHIGTDRFEALVSALNTSPRSMMPKQSTCSAPGTPGGALNLLIDDYSALPDTKWSWPVPSKTTPAPPRRRDPANVDSTPTALDLDALNFALPRIDGSSPTTDRSHGEDDRSEAQASQSSRYVHVSATVSEEARAARLQELIVKAKNIPSYKGWCGTSARGIIVVFHDVRGANDLIAQIELLLKSSRVSACPISRKMFEEQMLDADPLLQESLLSPSEGVLAITCNAPSHLRESSVLTLLSSMGSLRSFSIVEVGIVLCEYNDDRSAETARRELDGRVHDGIRFQCTFEPAMTKAMHLCAFGKKDPISTASWRSTSSPSTDFTSRDSYAAPISPLAPSFVPLKSIGEGSTPRDARVGSLDGPEGFNRGLQHSEYDICGALATSDVTALEARAEVSARQVWPRVVKGTDNSLRVAQSASHRRLSLASSSSVTSSSIPSLSSTTAPLSLPLTHGIYRDERIPRNNVIDLERIKRGLDLRTTLMLKNIPNKLKDVDVMKFIDESVGRCYQFLYIRLDWSSGCNVEDLARFVRARVGTRWNLANSDKICVGKAGLITHFRNSSVLDQDEDRRPKLFYSPGHPLAGRPEPFPACDDPVRRARSAANAMNVGLFPSSRPTFKVAKARPTQI
ncbi:BQ5605_C007g04533 [Microbotryum silenes-dioicae]|uniref:BQ5605_C007g04533 protein n=1 Tax=Microbotryum silenes-dioicae TaxID=796604 RepID=A0A2X0P9F1_9BASI|nr:BQ5605_C007g04533 [Microbotryum silenes-dioicae]